MRSILLIALLISGCIEEEAPRMQQAGFSIPIDPVKFSGFVSRNSSGPGNFSTINATGTLSFPINVGINWAGLVGLAWVNTNEVQLTSSTGFRSPGYMLSNSGVIGTPTTGTGITVNSQGYLRSMVNKVTYTEAVLTAAATTQDFTIWTLPTRSRVIRLVVESTVGFTGGAISNMQIRCGSAAGGTNYLVDNQIFSANVGGNGVAEIGSDLIPTTWADFTSFAGTGIVSCRFTSTSDNVVNATAGSVSIWVEFVAYP